MAARYWVGGTANWDATAGTKWSTTSGGSGGASVPTSSDDVFFDAASGAVTVTSTVGVSCLSINFTGFTGTFAGSTTFHIGGNVTLGSGMTSSFTGNFSIEVATATLRSNGISWLGNINLATTSGVYTLFDNWTVTSFSSGGANAILNGNSLNVLGSITMTQNMASGTTNINLTGTGTWSGSGQLKNNLTINTAGTITISGTVTYNTGTLTYTAGTVVTTGSTLNISASTTLNTNGIIWNNITITNSTITNSNDLTLVGTLTLGATASVTINGSNVNAGGNLSLTGSGASIISGTSGIILNGTGTWSHSFTSTLQNNLTINTAGTITISGNVYYSTGTLTVESGATVNTSGGTLNLLGTCSLNTSSISWNNVNFSGASQTYTLTSTLTANGTVTFTTGSPIINGSTLYCGGSLLFTAAGGNNLSGTTVIEFTGSGNGTWSSAVSSLQYRNNVIINKSGGILTLGTNLAYCIGTLTHIAGSVDSSANTLYIAILSTTLNTSGMTWNNVICTTAGALVITLTSDWNISGTATFGSSSQAMSINGSNVNISGILTSASAQVNAVSGTTTIRMIGTSCSIVDNSSIASPTLSMSWVCPIVIDTAGTCTITGRFSLGNGGSITWVAGTVAFTSSAVNISYLTTANNATVTINTPGVNWVNLIPARGSTFTLNALLSVSNEILINVAGTVTFTGTSGFTCDKFTFSPTVSRTVTLKSGNVYTINSTLTITGSSSAQKLTLQSNTTSYAHFDLGPSGSQVVTNTNATWINSSGGKTIWTSAGTLSNTVNWNIGTGASGMYKFFFG